MTKNTLRKNIILLLSSIIISTLFLEVTLRIILPTPIIWRSPQESYDFDPVIGHRLKPNQQAYTHDKAVTTNSFGIRDVEYSPTPAIGSYRILALGDSQTFGNGLELKDTWPKQFEAHLNQSSTDNHFEVLNCGLPGSDTWQHELIFDRMIANYNPNAAVLAFYVNDAVKRFKPNPARSKVKKEGNNNLIYLLKQSALLLTLRQVYFSFQKPTRANLKQQALLKGEDSEEIKERWLQVEKSLTKIKRAADKRNMIFFIASLPRRDHVDGKLSWDVYNKQLSTIAEKLGIPILSMLEPLQQGYETHNTELFIPWDGHNSKISNHIIAQEITREMLKQLKNNKLDLKLFI